MALWLKLAIIVGYAALSAGGLALMKAAKAPSLHYVSGFVAYGAAFAVWLFVILPSMPLSVAFPVSAGAIVLATLALGAATLGEALTPLKLFGAVLIIAGIAAIYFEPRGSGGAGLS
jgi:multidrug transporter EmrE-like cation transporter